MLREYLLTHKKPGGEDTYIYTLKPKNDAEIFSFSPGQYTLLTNPAYNDATIGHPFSIASSPLEKDHVEFCIKIYGDWTKTLSRMPLGSPLLVDDPRGNFIWDDSISNAVFLLGGIGIAPVMSMLRFLEQSKKDPTITLLYGNRTPETIAYKDELLKMQASFTHFSYVDIFSHLPDDHPWTGYRGFITPDIVEKEVVFEQQPTFFVIGPPIFIEKMQTLLEDFQVSLERIRTEDITSNQ